MVKHLIYNQAAPNVALKTVTFTYIEIQIESLKVSILRDFVQASVQL